MHPNRKAARNRRMILRLLLGARTSDLARRYGVTPGRVQQVCRVELGAEAATLFAMAERGRRDLLKRVLRAKWNTVAERTAAREALLAAISASRR